MCLWLVRCEQSRVAEVEGEAHAHSFELRAAGACSIDDEQQSNKRKKGMVASRMKFMSAIMAQIVRVCVRGVCTF